MNTTLLHVAIAAAWTGVGAAVATMLVKKHYREIAKEEIQSVKDHYRRDVAQPEVADDTPLTELTPDALETIRTSLTTTPQKFLDYRKLTKPYESTDTLESTPDAVTVEIVRSAVADREPYLVSDDEFVNEHEEYSSVSYTYFEEDDVLIDEQENIIDVPEDLLGDGLDHFGEISGDPSIVYISNPRLSINFEIVKDPRSYAEVVGGWRPTRNKRKDKFRDDD